MIIAITGGSGFIGKKLVNSLVAQGHNIRVLSRKPLNKILTQNAVEWFQGDLSTNMVLDAFLKNVDLLYHCAAEIRDESRMRALHVEGTQRLIDAARGHIKRWVQLSSVGVYGKQREGIVTENTPFSPLGVYEITKAESDILVEKAANEKAFGSTILRPSNVYGPGMNNQSLFSLIKMIRQGYFFFIGNKGASANYIHVDNVVEALIQCGTNPMANEQTFNLSDHCSLEQFVSIVATTLKTQKPKIRLPEGLTRVLAKGFGKIPGFPLTESRIDALTCRAIYSNQKIERLLNYQHIVSMENGIRQLTLAWLQDQM